MTRVVLEWYDINLAIKYAMEHHEPFTHPRTESLHRRLEELKLSSAWAESTVHAMIDKGLIDKLECEATNCLQPSREFFPASHRRDLNGLSIDHIKRRADGGNHRLENLRVVHYRCNCASGAGLKRPPEVGQKIGAKLRGQKRNDETKQRISESRKANTSVPVSCVSCRKTCMGTYGLSQHRAKSACGIRENV